jgi:hypothetical protein
MDTDTYWAFVAAIVTTKAAAVLFGACLKVWVKNSRSSFAERTRADMTWPWR